MKKRLSSIMSKRSIVYGLCLLILTLTMPSTVFAISGDGWYFEDFTTNPSHWSYEGTGADVGFGYNSNEGNIVINRKVNTGTANAYYTMPTPITSGTVAIEFDIMMNGVNGKAIEARFYNSNSEYITRYFFSQGADARFRNENDGGWTWLGCDAFAMNKVMHVKSVVNLDVEENNVQTYINGKLSDHTFNFIDKASIKNISRVTFTIASDNFGCSAVIDNFMIYEVGTEAEKVANSINAIDLGDLSNVKGNLSLPIEDTVNGTYILWCSDNEEVISNEGIYTRPQSDTKVKLTAYVYSYNDPEIVATKEFIANAVGLIKEDYYFEDFSSDSAKSKWVFELTGADEGFGIDTQRGNLVVNRKVDTGAAAATYNLTTPISSGTVVFEFDITLNGIDSKAIEARFLNSDGKYAARYFFSQGSDARIRNAENSGWTFLKVLGFDKDKKMHVKTMINLEEENGEVHTYINGILSETVATFVGPPFDKNDISKVVFTIAGDNAGASAVIDNFRCYCVGSKAEKVSKAESEFVLRTTSDTIADINNIRTDLHLPTEYNDVFITWTSSNESFISNTGDVTIPEQQIETVTLTAQFALDDVTLSKSFECILRPLPKYQNCAIVDENNDIVSSVSTGNVLYGRTQITNNSGLDENGVIALAIYSGNELKGVVIHSYSVPDGSEELEVKSGPLTVTATPKGDEALKAKMMIFDSMSNIIPLVDSVVTN